MVLSHSLAPFDLAQLAASADLIVDTRNAMAAIASREGQVIKA